MNDRIHIEASKEIEQLRRDIESCERYLESARMRGDFSSQFAFTVAEVASKKTRLRDLTRKESRHG